MVLMQYISVFFSGFVLSACPLLFSSPLLTVITVKLPFPLTLGFKSLLSKDIAMPDLDIRWVSLVDPHLVMFRTDRDAQGTIVVFPQPVRLERSVQAPPWLR